ncbi:glycine-rich protein [Streptomyces sp. NBC_01264]|uniref:glycine-rich protein n=1 Tax=Streptomyces sp. NBC_01264 TaxID=2903804 RepID=UPI0033905395
MSCTRPALTIATALLALTGLATTAHADNHDKDHGGGKSNHCYINVKGNHNTNACGTVTYGDNTITGNGHTVQLGTVLPQDGCTPPSSQTLCVYTTPGEHILTVPIGVRSIAVTAIGASGENISGAPGGKGARVVTSVPVFAGQILYIEVGATATNCDLSGCANPGYNGAGQGGAFGGGGGGASAVRTQPAGTPTTLASRIAIAGGGGGAGTPRVGCTNPTTLNGAGGDASKKGTQGALCADGVQGGTGGNPGTATQGGTGGSPPDAPFTYDGDLGQGGNPGFGGGGGGGGLYGGGAGGSPRTITDNISSGGGGGGGGSSLPTTETVTSEPASVTLTFSI